MPRIGRVIAIRAINRVAPDENVRSDISLSPHFLGTHTQLVATANLGLTGFDAAVLGSFNRAFGHVVEC